LHRELCDFGVIPECDIEARYTILDQFLQKGPTAIGLSPAGALDLAQMCQTPRRKGAGTHDPGGLAEQPHRRSHIKYLRDCLPSIGHEDLVSRLTACTLGQD